MEPENSQPEPTAPADRRIVVGPPAPPEPTRPLGRRGARRKSRTLRPADHDLTAAPVPKAGAGYPTMVCQSMAKAFNVDPMEVARFQPHPYVLRVGEAIASGLVQMNAIRSATGLDYDEVKGVLNDPVAMAWISQRVEVLFRFRAGLVDAALFMRAMAGDVAAIRLFFERHKLLADTKQVNVHYSGGVDVRALPTDELRKIVADKARMLPAEFRVISETSHDPGNQSGTPSA